MRIPLAVLVLLLLLPACGAQKAGPVVEATSGGEEGARAHLDTMVVPQEDVGGLPPRLRVTPDSGWRDNRSQAERSLEPGDSAATLAEAGRITGYELAYSDPTHAALRSGSGMDAVITWVELFSSDSAASAYLRDRVDYARGLGGTSPRAGVFFGDVLPFDIRMADEAYGLREPTVFGGDHIFRTLISFRRGHVVGGSMVVRADSGNASPDVERVAGVLDTRIQIALHGGPAKGKPVLIPKDGVPLDGQQATAARPPGAPDLAAIALGPNDLPPGIPCQPGRYTHTTPPRITFRRSFCPQRRAIGHTRLVALTSEVSAFELEVAAKTSLNLAAQTFFSASGVKTLVANFAATTGLVPTHIRSRHLKLDGGAVGMLTTFETTEGRVADFSAIARRGRGITTLDALGPAEGFDHRDLLPLLQAVERRLSTLPS